MGLFSQKDKSTMSDDTSESSDMKIAKKSLYERYKEVVRGPGISNLSDEELKKYIGMNRKELKNYSATTPGVAGGQAAGSLTAGGTSSFGMSGGTGEGLGGWGREASQKPIQRLSSASANK